MARRRVDGERGEAAETELFKAQACAALGHIRGITANVVIHPAELRVGEGQAAVGRPREHGLVTEDIAGLIALVGDVDRTVRGDRDRVSP